MRNRRLGLCRLCGVRPYFLLESQQHIEKIRPDPITSHDPGGATTK